jgi:hypothetical protein
MSELQPTPEFEEQIRMAMAVPDASPDFVKKLHNELVRGPVKMKSQFIFRPAWAIAFVFALAIGVVSMPGVAAALGRLFGYVPNVGLVENIGNLRMLAEPASLMREGVTLLIQNVIVYEDHVELSYEVEGIAPFNDGTRADDVSTNPTAFCGGMNIGDAQNKDGDARLRLPDGTLLERDYTGKYPQNVFAMKPVYETKIPADVTELTLILKCIPDARRGAVPENWEVPFKLMTVPAGTVVGAPVIEVEQPTAAPTLETFASTPTEEPALPAPQVTMTLEKIVPMESAAIFYFSMDMENKDPSLISIMPVSAYVVDSQGQKIQLIGNFVLQPFEHRTGSLFQYTSQSKPANGPLTVVVENAVAYYAPMYVEPRQATPEEMSFMFDVGENPQYGQTWELNNEFVIAGYPLKVTSARAVTFEEIRTPDFIDGSQGYHFGYEFALESDPTVKFNVWMDIMSESPSCWLSNGASWVPSDSTLLFTQLCREGYPNGVVKVTIGELSILLENTWQSTWTP